MDYTSYPLITKWVEEYLCGEGLNVLINNAALLVRENMSLTDVTRDNMMAHVEANAVAPLMLSQVMQQLQNYKSMLPLYIFHV